MSAPSQTSPPPGLSELVDALVRQLWEVRVGQPPIGDPEHSPYLTAKEAARYLRFASVLALYKAIPEDGIPCRRRGPKTLLFHRGDLDRWLAGARADALRREARSRRVRAAAEPAGAAERADRWGRR